MKTGDMASFDEDGFCNIVGRYKDIIIRGGENIFPKAIEELARKVNDPENLITGKYCVITTQNVQISFQERNV